MNLLFKKIKINKRETYDKKKLYIKIKILKFLKNKL